MYSHLIGLITPFVNSNMGEVSFWFGNGLGTGGTLSALLDVDLYYEMSKADVGGESAIGSMFYLVGLTGLIIFFGTYVYLIKKISAKSIFHGVLMLIYFLALILQENALSLIPSVMFFTFVMFTFNTEKLVNVCRTPRRSLS